jgi:drug/metabolite transporter (DMT)-like permease
MSLIILLNDILVARKRRRRREHLLATKRASSAWTGQEKQTAHTEESDWTDWIYGIVGPLFDNKAKLEAVDEEVACAMEEKTNITVHVSSTQPSPSPSPSVTSTSSSSAAAATTTPPTTKPAQWTGWKLWAGGSLCGIWLMSGSVLQQYGLVSVSAGIAAFITGCYSVFVPVFRFIFVRERPRFLHVVALAFAVAGMFLLSITDDEKLSLDAGPLVVLIGAFMWAFHVMSVDYCVEHAEPFRLTCIQAVFSAVTAFIGILIVEFGNYETPLTVDDALRGDVVWSILYLAIMSSSVAYGLQVRMCTFFFFFCIVAWPDARRI